MPSSRSLQYRKVAPVTHEEVKQMHIFDMMVNAIGLHAGSEAGRSGRLLACLIGRNPALNIRPTHREHSADDISSKRFA